MIACLAPGLRLLLAASAIALAGCGSICNAQNLCAVTGSGDDVQVCDGGDFRACGDGNRGQVINCPRDFKRAVCTTNGWTFEGQ
jgi:hypothetical protein